jgi:FOG: WD40-like repeat
LLAVLFLAGCAGGVRATSWTTLLLHDGALYVADLEQVRALDAETGQEVWAFPATPDLRQYGPFYTVTRLNDELLMVTSYERTGGGLFARSQGVLRALSLNGGRLAWPQPFTAAGEFIAPGAAGDGIFVIGNSDGNVYGLRIEDGTLIWQYAHRRPGLGDAAGPLRYGLHRFAGPLPLRAGPADRCAALAVPGGGAMADCPLFLTDTPVHRRF